MRKAVSPKKFELKKKWIFLDFFFVNFFLEFFWNFFVCVNAKQVLPLSTDNSICPMKRCSAADDPDYVKNFFKRNTIYENH
jgi:hypothetical protein